MRTDIAVATVSGKAYYVVVTELRKKNLPFLSLKPDEPIPAGIKVVITTEKEKPLINHDKVLVYEDGGNPEALISSAVQAVNDREHWKRLVIGVDPGDVFGLACLADEKVVETENCFSIGETLERIASIVRNLNGASLPRVVVRIGDGVPECNEELLSALDSLLPQDVVLESVSEIGTSRVLNETKHRRGFRDMLSAVRIAGKTGHRFERRKT